MAIIKKKIENLKPGKSYLINVRAKNPDLNSYSDNANSIIVTMPQDATIPTDITNLSLHASFQNVMFVFDASNDKDFETFEYELYPIALGTGTKTASGFSPANVFTVAVPNSTDAVPKSYWGKVRGIDTTGNVGVWSPLVQTDADTPLIDSQYINSLTASKITAGTIGSHEIILNGVNSILKSSNYLAATGITGGTGWKIDGAGGAVFNEASIRSKLDIGEDLGTTDATSFHVDINGNMWSGASSTNYATAPFRVANTGDITANSITLTGDTILATDAKLYLGAGNYNNLDTGFYVDSDGYFSLKDKLTWDGTTLAVVGDITGSSGTFSGSLSGATITGATGTFSGTITADDGSIGGWTIGPTSISSSGTSLNSDGSIYTPNFYVDADGNMYASSGTFSGSITGASGAFAGTVSASNITAGTINGSNFTAGNTSIDSSGNVYLDSTNGQIIFHSNWSGNVMDISITNSDANSGIKFDTNWIGSTAIIGQLIKMNNADFIYGREIIGLVASVGGSIPLYFDGGYVKKASSKRELKDNISNFTNFNLIDELSPKTFIWKPKKTDNEETELEKSFRESDINIGFIAEEVAAIGNGCLGAYDLNDDGSRTPSFYRTNDILALCVATIKDLRARINILETT